MDTIRPYWAILGNIGQYWTILDNIWQCMNIFANIWQYMEYLWWLDGWLTEWLSDLMTQRLTQPNLAYASKKLICIWRFYHLRIIFSRVTRPQGQSLVIFAFGKNWLKLLSSVTKRSVTVVQLDKLCAVKIQSPNKKLD